MVKVFKVKVDTSFYEKILAGQKTAIRKISDRYEELDKIEYHEFSDDEPTGRSLKVVITRIDRDCEGLMPGYALVEFRKCVQ